MSKKSKYSEVCSEIESKIKASVKPSGKIPVSTSNSDMNLMAQTLLNSPEHEVIEYNPKITDEAGKPMQVIKQPSKRYRESLKPMLRSMGIDKDEVNKIDEYQFSKESASALMGVAGTILKDYIDLGRKYKFPITSLDESQMSISTVAVNEKVTETKKFDKDANGNPISVPTGKVVKTKKHKNIKVSNTVPHWLKEEI